MNLSDVFGINVLKRFSEWFHGPFTVEFHQRFGDDAGITYLLLDPDRLFSALLHWDDPAKHLLLTAVIGDELASSKLGGTFQNVLGKLQFCLRNLADSVLAETSPELVRMGDFPWEGAGMYNGPDDEEKVAWPGGVSGLSKEDDWAVFCQCTAYIVNLVTAVTKLAMAKAEVLRHAEGAPANVKYLHVVVTDDELDAALATAA